MLLAEGETALGKAAEDASGESGLHGLCRLVRRRFDVAAVSASFTDGQAGAIDVAAHSGPGDAGPAHAVPDSWQFAASLDGRPDAPDQPILCEDVAGDAALARWSALAGRPDLRFFASLPFGPNAEGRLALFDTRPRHLSASERQELEEFASLAGVIAALSRRAEAAETREASFRLLAEASTDTIVRGTLDGIRSYVSPSVRELLGYEPEELIGRRAAEIVHPDDLAPFVAMMRQVRDGTISRGRSEMRQRHKDGSWVWLEAFLRVTRDPATGKPDGYVTSVRDVGVRKSIEAELARRANHDELTGLPNRKLFRERLVAAIDALGRGGPPFALLWMDLDHFKWVNDRYGHPAGDAVLVEAAARFRSVIRADDLVARLGGDEFAAIRWLGDGPGDAEALGARLIAAVAPPFRFAQTEITVGLSVGIAFASVPGSEADTVLAEADTALYRAKSAGRNRLCGPE